MMQQLLLGMGAIINDVHAAVTHSSSPYINVYPWDNGFGTKLSDPSTLPAGQGKAVAFSPDKKFIAVAHETSPRISVYHWSNNGFGSKVSNPSTLPTNHGQEVRWSPDGSVLAVGHSGSNGPFSFYAWSSSGFGSRYTNPSDTEINECHAIRWTSDGSFVLVGGTKSSGGAKPLEAYAWSNASGFGTRYVPSTAPTDKVTGIAFSPSEDYVIATQTGASVFARTYPWSANNQFGGNITKPSDTWSDDAEQVQFTAAGNDVAFVGAGSPYVAIWPWTGSGYGTKYSNPSTLPGGFGYGLGIHPDDNAILVGATFSPSLHAYPFTSGSGFGTRYSNPSTMPGNACRKVAFE